MLKSLEWFKLAYDIHPSEKLKSRIKKIQEAIKEMALQDSDSEDEEFVNVNNSGLMLFKELHDKLYHHQIEGVAFLYSLYRGGCKGGILADDMGLGKTIQVISFLSGMYDAELAKLTLLVMPTSLIKNWTREFAKWTPGMRVKEFHGSSKLERTRNLEKIQRRGGVIITTYQMLINNWELLASYNGQEFKWDYVILDEAHKIKTSSTKTAKSAHAIPAQNRILLTGTPVQNNLREMWALFDFACQGALLGTSKTFKTEYENPITRAREKDATPGEKALGLKMSENLMAIINPYFLRRTKAEVQLKKLNSTAGKEECLDLENKENNIPNQISRGAVMPTLTRKNDLVIWTYLSTVQEDIYNQFISLDHIKELLMTSRSPLAELNILKKLCDHPRLLSARAVAQLGLEEGTSGNGQDDEHESAANRIDNISDETLITESGKLLFLVALLERLKQEGHRTLVFSQSRKMLDIIERVLVNKHFRIVRIDGTVLQLAERERRISLFQTNKQYSVFLLTTQVGGVGITLTAANRVVIFDPSWNPATDAQAVDRAYRIGQTENVVIYRLITCGTVEEKIYRRQVFKDSLIRQTTGDKKNPFRYFSKQELYELFTLQDTRSSSTQLQLQSLHSRQRRTDQELDEHIAYLHSIEMFGISDHDLMFSNEVSNQEDAPEDQESHTYIENRIQKAQELMKAESEVHKQLADSIALSTEPAWLRKPAQSNTLLTEKKPNKTKPSPLTPSNDHFNNSLALVDLTQSESGDEDVMQNLTRSIIDLDVDESFAVEEPFNVSQKRVSKSKEGSPMYKPFEDDCTDVEAIQTSLRDVSSEIEDNVLAEEGSTSLDCITSVNDLGNNLQNECASSHDESDHKENVSDMRASPAKPLENKQLSVLQMSNMNMSLESSLQVDAEIESFHANFNLHLEDSDSDMFPEEDTEAKERTSGFQLQLDSVNNSSIVASEKVSLNKENESYGQDVHLSEAEHSFVVYTRKKKRAALIYDSEEDEEAEERLSELSELENCFNGVGASTPKSVKSKSVPFKGRKSFGGNTSVASRRSLVESVLEDVADLDEEAMEDEVSDEYTKDGGHEREIKGSRHDSFTFDTENDESKDDASESMQESEVGDGKESQLGEVEDSLSEESTSDPELASSEIMDQYTAGKDVPLCKAENVIIREISSTTDDKNYESLVF
ncbi:DNA excision repair protein ERCC-6-like [Aplochiton taeniatus]